MGLGMMEKKNLILNKRQAIKTRKYRCILYMGVSKSRGTPKWMVKIMENPIKIDDLGVITPIFGLTPIWM